MTNELIARARKKYLAKNPPRIAEIQGHTLEGAPAGFIKLPNIGDMGIIGCKLGMEYLAICHDDDAVEEWVHTCLGITKSPELAGILFANVFRGMNQVVAALADRPGVREHLERQAVDAWLMDFGGDAA